MFGDNEHSIEYYIISKFLVCLSHNCIVTNETTNVSGDRVQRCCGEMHSACTQLYEYLVVSVAQWHWAVAPLPYVSICSWL